MLGTQIMTGGLSASDSDPTMFSGHSQEVASASNISTWLTAWTSSETTEREFQNCQPSEFSLC